MRLQCAGHPARPTSWEEAKCTVGIASGQEFMGRQEGAHSQETMTQAREMEDSNGLGIMEMK